VRKKILIALAIVLLLFVGLLGFIASRPSQFRIERSATIAAPPEQVFGHVNNLQQWNAWSPWAKKDPNAKATFEGPEEGEGAIFRWAGNDEIGEGAMTITQSKPAELVVLKLEFKKPFEDTSMAQFKFTPEGENTVVTWSMEGQCNFVSKAVQLFLDMDKMLGADFEAGLANMKKVVEESPKSESTKAE